MDPELQDLMRQVQAARANGRSLQEINARLKSATEGRYTSVTALRAAAAHGGGGVPGGAFGATARSVARGVAGGFLDEGAGLLAGLGAAVVPGGEGFSEARERVTEQSRGRAAADRQAVGGVLSTAGEVVGSLLPGGTVARGVAAAAPRVGRFARSAIAGGAEGGLLGAGTGDDGDRLERGLVGAGTGAAAGSILGGVVSAARAGRRASKLKPKAGARLGESARDASGLSGKPSRVLDDVAERKRSARELVQPLEELGREEIPEEISQAVMGNSVLRAEAERVAPKVVSEAAEKGQAARFTFDELDTVVRSIRNDASAFKKASGGSLPTNVRPVNVKKAESALEELDDVMGEHLDNFPEFRTRWAREKATQRALLDGRKLWTKHPDDVQAAWEALPDDPQVQDAFREGLASELIFRLEKLSEPTASLRKLVNAPAHRAKLRIIFNNSEEALEKFTDDVLREQKVRDLAHDHEEIMRTIRRKILPWIGGSGLVGGGAAGGAKAVESILGD